MPPGAGAACPQHPTHGGRRSSRWEAAAHERGGRPPPGHPTPSPFLPPAPTSAGDRTPGAIQLSPSIQLSPPLAGQGGGPENHPCRSARRQGGHLSRDERTGRRPCRGTTTCPGPAHRSGDRPAPRAGPACRSRCGKTTPPEWGLSSASEPCPTGGIHGNISSGCLCSLSWCGRSACPGEGSSFYGSGQAPSWRVHGAELGLHPSAQPGSSAGGIRLSPRRLAPHSWRQGVKCRILKSSHPLPSALASGEQGEGGEILPA
jgi:hypothetical protein